MERLTYKNTRGEWCVKNNTQCAIASCSNENGKYYIGEPINRLAELEDEIENGMLVKLPCNVGDTIYFVDEPLAEFNRIQEFVAKEIRYTKDECQVWIFDDLYIGADDFGNYAFLTREEAEKRLEELKG